MIKLSYAPLYSPNIIAPKPLKSILFGLLLLSGQAFQIHAEETTYERLEELLAEDLENGEISEEEYELFLKMRAEYPHEQEIYNLSWYYKQDYSLSILFTPTVIFALLPTLAFTTIFIRSLQVMERLNIIMSLFMIITMSIMHYTLLRLLFVCHEIVMHLVSDDEALKNKVLFFNYCSLK